MIRKIMTMASLLCVLLSAPAHASDFVQGCMRVIEFNMMDSKKFEQAKTRIEKVCACQEQELLKTGINAMQLSEFVKGAGSEMPHEESVPANVRIAALINGPDIQKTCGSPFF